MKRIGYFTLAILCLLQSGCMLLIYQFRQCYVQVEMRHALKNPNSPFQRLTLSLNDFQKSKINAHEIAIDGKMYDIKSVKFTSGQVEFLAIRDIKEESILKVINKIIGFNQGNDDKIPNQLLVLLSMVYLTPDTFHSFFFQKNNFVHDVFLIPSICSCPQEIFSPPPEKS